MGRNTRRSRVFLPTLLSYSSSFLSALQQNRAQSRLLYLLIQGTLFDQLRPPAFSHNCSLFHDQMNIYIYTYIYIYIYICTVEGKRQINYKFIPTGLFRGFRGFRGTYIYKAQSYFTASPKLRCLPCRRRLYYGGRWTQISKKDLISKRLRVYCHRLVTIPKFLNTSIYCHHNQDIGD